LYTWLTAYVPTPPTQNTHPNSKVFFRFEEGVTFEYSGDVSASKQFIVAKSRDERILQSKQVLKGRCFCYSGLDAKSRAGKLLPQTMRKEKLIKMNTSSSK